MLNYYWIPLVEKNLNECDFSRLMKRVAQVIKHKFYAHIFLHTRNVLFFEVETLILLNAFRRQKSVSTTR